MPDKPQPASPLAFSLPDRRVLALCGRDAMAFAQSQFMNDVAVLGDGQWQWNGWLTPKGRVIALFALVRFDAQSLWLLLADTDPAELAARLQRYVFRSRLTLQPRDELHAHAAFATPQAGSGSALARIGDAAIELDMGCEAGPRTLTLTAHPAAADADAVLRWNAVDLACGLPHLPASQVELWTPQQLSLDRIQAFSVKKGCYPGQEIVARTHFLGQVKRGIAVFETPIQVAAGAEVRDADRALGTIVSSVGDTALAVLPLERDADAPLFANEARLQERPLLAGLAR